MSATIRVGPRPGDLGRVLEMHGRLYADEFGYDEEFEAHVANGLAGFAAALGERRADPSLPEPGWLWIAEDTTDGDPEVVGMIGLNAAARLYTSLGFRRTEEVPGHRFGQDLVEVRYDLDLTDRA